MAAFRLQTAARTLLEHRWTVAVDRLAGRLDDLNSDRVLARGYSRTVLERTGGILTRAADATAGDLLRTHLAQGTLKSRVTEAPQMPQASTPSPAPNLSRRGKKDRGPEPSLFE
jgi:exonuclease VII large subunit